MQRIVTLSVGLMLLVAVSAGCAGPGVAGPGVAGPGAAGSVAAGSVAVGAAQQMPAGAASAGAGRLPACLVGAWHTSAAREFEQLGRIGGSQRAIRTASGMIRMRFAADHGFTFSYDKVTLGLASGEARVDGPVTGTWALVGNSLTATPKKTAVKIAVTVAGVRIDPAGSFDTLLASITPNGSAAVCAGDRLTLAIVPDPSSGAAGVVVFDRG